MALWTNAIVIAIVVTIAIGQVLFKYAANGMKTTDYMWQISVLGPLFVAFAIYGLATLAWVWVLQSVPLSRAYPYMAIAFLLVPAASYVVFGERLDARYALGVLFICGGVILVAR